MNDEDEFAANLAKATGTGADPASKPKAPRKSKPKHVTVGKPPAAEPAIADVPDAGEDPIHQVIPQPGSPCQKKGCLGRYSILQTVKQGRSRVRHLICRTCQHQPAEPHRSNL